MPRPALVRGFFATLEEPLQPEADAEERNARADACDERVADVHFVEGAQHLAEVADAWQDDFRRALEPCRIADQLKGCADRIERILHGAEVARAVVKDRDHSNPFVEGSWSLSWASIEQA